MTRSKPRVAFWTPILYRAGGTETWHTSLIRGLSQGDAVEVVGLGVLNPAECDPVKADELSQYCLVETGPEALACLASLVDVLIFWGMGDPQAILPADRPHTIFVSHGNDRSFWQREVARTAAPVVDLFMGVSEAALTPIPQERRPSARVIPNGVDASRLLPSVDREAQRRLWGVPAGRKVVGLLSRFSEEKDPFALARCVYALPSEWFGVAVGDGVIQEEVWAHGYAYAPNSIVFPGMTTDVGSALNAFDVLLCPSLEEGFGLSALEGVMAEVPVVSTPVGVMPMHLDWFRFVEVGAKPGELAGAVVEADRMTRLDRQRIASEAAAIYGSERFVQDWADLILEVAGWSSTAS